MFENGFGLKSDSNSQVLSQPENFHLSSSLKFQSQISSQDLSYFNPSYDSSLLCNINSMEGGFASSKMKGIYFYTGVRPGEEDLEKFKKDRILRKEQKKVWLEEDGEEWDTIKLMDLGLGPQEQEEMCRRWKEGKFLCLATKYKPVAKKVRPVNDPMPQNLNPPLRRPQMSRDPYNSPLTPYPPDFVET